MLVVIFGCNENHEPPSPIELRVLRPEVLADAAEVLTRLSSAPFVESAREELSQIYANNGYEGAARFFDHTVREMRGEPVQYQPATTGIAWSASARDLNGEADAIAKQMAHLVSLGKYEAAIQHAAQEMESDQPSLAVSIQWADSVVSRCIRNPTLLSENEIEMAVRVFLTSLFERAPRPVGVPTTASGFEKLSNLFIRLGDWPSALTASRLALDSLRELSENDNTKDVAAARLRERIEKLSAKRD